jgi:hypothetical protein
MEEAMRRIVLATTATLTILAAGSLGPNRAEAMTVTTPAGLQAVIDGTTLLEDVQVRCRRVWRCGPYGCGWRRACWRAAPFYGGYGGYGVYGGGPYYGGYYRPYRRYGW